MTGVLRHIVIVVCLLGLFACAAAPQTQQLLEQTPATLRGAQQLDDVPFFPQTEYQCGPAALATLLANTHIPVTADELVPQVYLPARQGSLQPELLGTARRYERIPFVIPGTLQALLAEIDDGRPVLVLQNLGLQRLPRWHYAVVVGYDLAAAELTLRSGTIRDYRVAMSVFERTWQRADHWAMLSIAAGDVPASANPELYFQALAETEQTGLLDLTAAWQAGHQRWPEHSLIAMGLSNHLYQQGDRQAAIDVLEHLLSIHPDYAPARQNLRIFQQQP